MPARYVSADINFILWSTDF